MALEVGSIVEGKVSGIVKFGAFVDLGEGKTGLVHISEIAHEYVEDVNEFLKVGDEVKVKIISIDNHNKFALSIKQAQSNPEHKKSYEKGNKSSEYKNFHHENNLSAKGTHAYRKSGNAQNFRSFQAERKREDITSFEDKISKFLKESDERLLDLKRNVESKRGGRGGRRSD